MVTQDIWNRFVLENGPKSGRFLQSWEWGEFQKAFGEEVVRETFEENGKLVGVAQWIKREVPMFGKYRFCQKGPIISNGFPLFNNSRLTPSSRSKRELVGIKNSEMFFRIEPERLDSFPRAYKTSNINPADTLITDLSHSEDELLAAMHSKTRYNIGVAKRHGVRVNFEYKDFDSVWKLFSETSSRGQFRLHPKKYYETMLSTLCETGCRVFLAIGEKDKRILAANIMVDFGNTRTYLHGASSNENRNVMAPYLLHWELMREAKIRGLRFYDWWGIAPKMDFPPCPRGGQGGRECIHDHPWSGISRFKRGFGGEEVSTPGTYDMVLKPSAYYFYQTARFLTRSLRRFV